MPEPLPPEARRALREVLDMADTLRTIGVTDHRQVQARPGPAGFLMRLAGLLAEPAQCECGGEHMPSDHDG